MKGKFQQYFYSVLFAVLTVLGWYYGMLQQYISLENDSDFLTSEVSQAKQNSSDELKLYLNGNEANDIYNIIRPHYHKLSALSESDSENDENAETSYSPEIAIFTGADFWLKIPAFLTTFHNNKNTVAFAHSEQQIPLSDDLYIQYRVIRL